MKYTLVAGLALLTTDALFAQNAGQSDVDALKAQMNQMQRQYEQRIEAMEAKMKSLESNANGGSILNTRILTDANGTEAPGKAPAPMLDESFLKSLTRNLTFNVYMRAGFAFNGSGGSGAGDAFVIPDNYTGGGRSTSRLGNEPDFYTELALTQAHILGDSPDVMDVSFTAQFQADSGSAGFRDNAVNTGTSGVSMGLNQGFAEMKNVFKSAPEITFWGGDRFYDRWNIDSEDYFWLNTSGFGVGVYNIPAGPGTIGFAWFGSSHDNLNQATDFAGTPLNQFDRVGNLFKQTLDLRYHDIDIGFGKLTFVLLGNYVKGNAYQLTETDVLGTSITGVVKTQDMWGGGGGAIWEYDFGNKSMFRLSFLAGHGPTDFQSGIGNQLATVDNAWLNQINRFVTGRGTNDVQVIHGVTTAAVNAVSHSTDMLATAYFVWNPTECFAMGLWANWENSNQGFNPLGINASVPVRHSRFLEASGTRNLVTVGIRPVYWLWDNIAIQGAASFAYEDNDRFNSGTPSFGKSGQYGIFTIAPTLKAKGGFFTRPEIRVFATYVVWSNSLKGTMNGGSLGNGAGVPPYNGNTNQGWLIGSQMEIWF